MKPAFLVVEDGFEWSDFLGRFASAGTWARAGNGAEALALVKARPFAGAFLDLRFDRIPDDALLGDWAAVVDRYAGDPDQARKHLADQQGLYVLAALRAAGFGAPVMLARDFAEEPRRWGHLLSRYAPLDGLPDDDGPGAVRRWVARIAGAVPGGPERG